MSYCFPVHKCVVVTIIQSRNDIFCKLFDKDFRAKSFLDYVLVDFEVPLLHTKDISLYTTNVVIRHANESSVPI